MAGANDSESDDHFDASLPAVGNILKANVKNNQPENEDQLEVFSQ